MTTIINTPPNGTDVADNSAGWGVAVIILLVVIGIGAYFWVHHYRVAPAPSGGTNINVTLPTAPGTQSQPTQ